MREILFRGKRRNHGEWIYGDLVTKQNICIANDWHEVIRVDDETVGQFTGLTDKNGKQIFEGDIAKTGYGCYKVCFENGCFGFVVDETDMFYYITFDVETAKEVEVIGNIYDNPELLGSAE